MSDDSKRALYEDLVALNVELELRKETRRLLWCYSPVGVLLVLGVLLCVVGGIGNLDDLVGLGLIVAFLAFVVAGVIALPVALFSLKHDARIEAFGIRKSLLGVWQRDTRFAALTRRELEATHLQVVMRLYGESRAHIDWDEVRGALSPDVTSAHEGDLSMRES